MSQKAAVLDLGTDAAIAKDMPPMPEKRSNTVNDISFIVCPPFSNIAGTVGSKGLLLLGMEWEEAFELAREDPYQVVLPRKAKRKRFVTSDPYMFDCVVEPDVTGEFLEFKRRWELLEEFLRKRARRKEPCLKVVGVWFCKKKMKRDNALVSRRLARLSWRKPHGRRHCVRMLILRCRRFLSFCLPRGRRNANPPFECPLVSAR